MNEPWISNTGITGGILGSAIGILGAVFGTLAGICVPKGKAKRLVMGVGIFAVILSLILLTIGIVAYLSGQPHDVWYLFGYTGLLCTVSFGVILPVILKQYRKSELRKSMSEDLTFGGNETQNINNWKEKETSNE